MNNSILHLRHQFHQRIIFFLLPSPMVGCVRYKDPRENNQLVIVARKRIASCLVLPRVLIANGQVRVI